MIWSVGALDGSGKMTVHIRIQHFISGEKVLNPITFVLQQHLMDGWDLTVQKSILTSVKRVKWCLWCHSGLECLTEAWYVIQCFLEYSQNLTKSWIIPGSTNPGRLIEPGSLIEPWWLTHFVSTSVGQCCPIVFSCLQVINYDGSPYDGNYPRCNPLGQTNVGQQGQWKIGKVGGFYRRKREGEGTKERGEKRSFC